MGQIYKGSLTRCLGGRLKRSLRCHPASGSRVLPPITLVLSLISSLSAQASDRARQEKQPRSLGLEQGLKVRGR
jgi:hypothetical protein